MFSTMAASRLVEIDADTVEALETEAQSRGLTLAEFLRSLASEQFAPLPPALEAMREQGRGPWTPQALAEDARTMAGFDENGEGFAIDEIAAWMESWGTTDEMPMPRPRRF